MGCGMVEEVKTQDQLIEEEYAHWLATYTEAKEGLLSALRKINQIGKYPRPPSGVRYKLPVEREGKVHSFRIGYGPEQVKIHLKTGTYTDGELGEIFLNADRTGSMISGLMDAFATVVSIALQHGVPLENLVDKFSHVRFEPAGSTNNKSIPRCLSMIDYVARWLDLRYLQTVPRESELEVVKIEPKKDG